MARRRLSAFGSILARTLTVAGANATAGETSMVNGSRPFRGSAAATISPHTASTLLMALVPLASSARQPLRHANRSVKSPERAGRPRYVVRHDAVLHAQLSTGRHDRSALHEGFGQVVVRSRCAGLFALLRARDTEPLHLVDERCAIEAEL